MNQEQVTSIVRQALLAGGGFVVGKGWVDQETFLALAGALSVVAGSAWAIYSRRARGIVESAAALPNVAKIVTDQKTANAVPSAKVVPTGAA